MEKRLLEELSKVDIQDIDKEELVVLLKSIIK